MTRTRSVLPALALLAAATLTGCGSDAAGAPTDASEKDFCEASFSLYENMDLTADPSDAEQAEALNDWGNAMAEAGTPEGISADARKGFEITVEAVQDISESDVSDDSTADFLGEVSDDELKQVDAYTSYVLETCGAPDGGAPEPDVE